MKGSLGVGQVSFGDLVRRFLERAGRVLRRLDFDRTPFFRGAEPATSRRFARAAIIEIRLSIAVRRKRQPSRSRSRPSVQPAANPHSQQPLATFLAEGGRVVGRRAAPLDCERSSHGDRRLTGQPATGDR